jgi:hypothetical protein
MALPGPAGSRSISREPWAICDEVIHFETVWKALAGTDGPQAESIVDYGFAGAPRAPWDIDPRPPRGGSLRMPRPGAAVRRAATNRTRPLAEWRYPPTVPPSPGSSSRTIGQRPKPVVGPGEQERGEQASGRWPLAQNQVGSSGEPGGRGQHPRVGKVLAVLVRVAQPHAPAGADDELRHPAPWIIYR